MASNHDFDNFESLKNKSKDELKSMVRSTK